MPRELKIENARITGTMLGIEDHGIFTCMVHLQGEGWGCGFGGYAFDEWDEAKGDRVGCGFGIEFIRRVMEAAEVGKWEDLKGKHVRVETEGWGGQIRRIGHILSDKHWFDPKALAAEIHGTK